MLRSEKGCAEMEMGHVPEGAPGLQFYWWSGRPPWGGDTGVEIERRIHAGSWRINQAEGSTSQKALR